MKARILIVLLCAVVLHLFAFQNCSNISPLFKGSREESSGLKGNGEGYGGITHTFIKLAALACSDGSKVDSRIIINETFTLAAMTRERCQEIVPRSIDMREIQILPQNQLIYQNQLFEIQNPAVPVPSPTPPSSGTMRCLGSRIATSGIGIEEVQVQIFGFEAALVVNRLYDNNRVLISERSSDLLRISVSYSSPYLFYNTLPDSAYYLSLGVDQTTHLGTTKFGYENYLDSYNVSCSPN